MEIATERIEKTAELNGKTLHFWSDTIFIVECSKSKNDKSGYETRNTVVGDLGRAVMFYNGINIGNGYKKRLKSPTLGILAKQSSW